MKVTLVYPPSFELNLKGYPFGLAYLSASLKRRHMEGCRFTNCVTLWNSARIKKISRK